METKDEKRTRLYKEYDILCSLKKETENELEKIKKQIFQTMKQSDELRGSNGTINRS